MEIVAFFNRYCVQPFLILITEINDKKQKKQSGSIMTLNLKNCHIPILTETNKHCSAKGCTKNLIFSVKIVGPGLGSE